LTPSAKTRPPLLREGSLQPKANSRSRSQSVNENVSGQNDRWPVWVRSHLRSYHGKVWKRKKRKNREGRRTKSGDLWYPIGCIKMLQGLARQVWLVSRDETGSNARSNFPRLVQNTLRRSSGGTSILRMNMNVRVNINRDHCRLLYWTTLELVVIPTPHDFKCWS
jgi:hypothetical protein